MSLTEPPPCDRGIPNNVLSRGLHNFVSAAGMGSAVCSYCGLTRSDIGARRNSIIRMAWHPDLEVFEKAAVTALTTWEKLNPSRAPSAIRANAYTLNALATRSGQQNLDVNDGGWLMGVAFEVDDTLNRGEFMVNGDDPHPTRRFWHNT